MKFTIYHAHYRTARLINAIDFERNKDQLGDLQSCLKKINQFLESDSVDSTELTTANEYRKAAIEINSHIHLFIKKSYRLQLESIYIALICIAQKIENISTPSYINKYQQKLISIIQNSHEFNTTVLRPLCQQLSIYIAGHKGICALSAREWLANNFMNNIKYTSGISSINSSDEKSFVKLFEFSKDELLFLYDVEKKKIKSSLTFFFVTGILRLSNGSMILSLLEELSGNKRACFLITFAHFRNRIFHSVGCKYSQELIQWFDSDCGIFQSQDKNKFGDWLDFYLKQNKYLNKFSFFNVQLGKSNPALLDVLDLMHSLHFA